MSARPAPSNLGPEGIDPTKQLAKDNASATSFLAELRASSENTEPGASKPRKSLSLATILVPVALVICAGLLWGMRKVGMASMVGFADMKIDYTPDQAAKGDTKHQRLLTELERSGNPVQVPTDQITKNPFKLVAADTAPDTDTRASDEDAQREVEARARALAEQQKKITEALGKLSLQGVLLGSVPVARISNEPVRVGDTIAEVFTVASITGRTVTLTADGKEYVLSMEEPKQNSKLVKRR